MQQYDVKSGHLNESGFIYTGRTRVKNVTYAGNAAQAGMMHLYDTTVAPVAATYERAAGVVTVTKNAHGLSTGDVVGIGFAMASGVSATAGNYVITKTGASTFTIADPNSGTVAAGTVCNYTSAGRWLTGFCTLTSATGGQQVMIPGEGMLAANGVYALLTNITFVTVFYG